MKSLYNENYCYTEDGKDLCNETHNMLSSLIEHIKRENFNLKEAQCVVNECVAAVFAEKCMLVGINNRKNKRKNSNEI